MGINPDSIGGPVWVCDHPQRAALAEVAAVALDLAHYALQAHAADASGRVALRKKLRRHQVLSCFARLPACVVAGGTWWCRFLEPRTGPAVP